MADGNKGKQSQIIKQKKSTRTKRSRRVRNFPASSFEEALNFAKEILEFGSGQAVRRVTLFDHIGKSPESGPSRQLITNANKYGLIKGGYQAEQLELTPEGKRAADEHIQARERLKARVQLAIMNIPPFRALYDSFCGNRLPAKAALIDKIKENDVDEKSAEEAVDTFIVNLRYVGLLKTLSGADRIITEDHLLNELPANHKNAENLDEDSTPKNVLITSDVAQFERVAFYIAPIGDAESEHRKHSDLFLGSIIEPTLESLKLKVVRADKIDRPGIITKQIIEYLIKSRLVIADLSYHNPNVFYELAIRHMLRKPVVQLMRKADSLPFDVNQVRTIVIDTTDIYSLVPQIDSYRSEIAAQVRRALDNPDAADSPISAHFPDLNATS